MDGVAVSSSPAEETARRKDAAAVSLQRAARARMSALMVQRQFRSRLARRRDEIEAQIIRAARAAERGAGGFARGGGGGAASC